MLKCVPSSNSTGCSRRVHVDFDLENAEPARQLLPELRAKFAGKTEIQGIFAPNYGVLFILEAFSAGTTKFSALVYVGQAMRLGTGLMAAIGDDYNDISMLAGVARSAAPRDAPSDGWSRPPAAGARPRPGGRRGLRQPIARRSVK